MLVVCHPSQVVSQTGAGRWGEDKDHGFQSQRIETCIVVGKVGNLWEAEFEFRLGVAQSKSEHGFNTFFKKIIEHAR